MLGWILEGLASGGGIRQRRPAQHARADHSLRGDRFAVRIVAEEREGGSRFWLIL